MSAIGQPERATQNHAVKLLRDQLGYKHVGSWAVRDGNANIEEAMLRANLKARGYDEILIKRALNDVLKAAAVGGARSLYEANRAVYDLLRYGVKVKRSVSDPHETVWLIDWEHPDANEFVAVEEVTIKGQHDKRPDVVLYVNGLALAVIEFKRSRVSVSEGIRQNIGNQQQHFIKPFFSTVQFLFAANEVEGVRYAVMETPEKYWLEWKEPSGTSAPMDRALLQMCSKERLLELIHDFIVFDSGVKKTARPNQYFGVKAAQLRVADREGGIIWHTQGSGKSLTMVWLARWIREHREEARVLLITDRTELDEQIEGVFHGVHEDIYRTSSGADLIGILNQHNPWLMCSLVHKFRGGDDDADLDEAGDEFIAELNAKLPEGFRPKGNLFVFVDEAHRTQSGKMHQAMKALLPDAIFIGFTGTPLLKADTATTIETFGRFIHTYKFDEAVRDGVVLDLRYEARDIGQELKGAAHVDAWFDAKTKGLTDLSKARLKKRWGTMQNVVSAKSRATMIAQDILLDFAREPRLVSGRGNAMLVGQSIYQACKFYEMFVAAGFKGQCAIVTSYIPKANDIAKEDSGEGYTEKLLQYEIYRQMLADYFDEPADKAVLRIDEFDEDVKRRFVKEPGQMRLLIVVDKLLTGFDAPSATYLYIDKKMQDHGLFQAICRVNRLDGDDKTYGYIVDYRDLFKSLTKAYTDYTTEAFDGYEKKDIEGLLEDRIEKAREDLDDALDKIRALVEPVKAPKGIVEYQHYFVCEEMGDTAQINANESLRIAFYKAVAELARAYAAIANDMDRAGYTEDRAAAIKAELARYVAARDEVELGAGERGDLKRFEAGMRALLDTYIQADPAETVAVLQKGLVELITEHGAEALGLLPPSVRNNPQAAAETIVHNVRKTIVDEHAMNPQYYDKMSALLDALIEQRNQEALDYKDFLAKVVELASAVGSHQPLGDYPEWASTHARRALIDFGWPPEVDAHLLYKTIQREKSHDWAPNKFKRLELANAIRNVLPSGFPGQRLDELIALLQENDEFR
jgi:type I restriction enzyme, R subunit